MLNGGGRTHRDRLIGAKKNKGAGGRKETPETSATPDERGR